MEEYEKSGKVFIAYRGQELKERDIVLKLQDICPTDLKFTNNILLFI